MDIKFQIFPFVSQMKPVERREERHDLSNTHSFCTSSIYGVRITAPVT
jgi:hypothetical protein